MEQKITSIARKIKKQLPLLAGCYFFSIGLDLVLRIRISLALVEPTFWQKQYNFLAPVIVFAIAFYWLKKYFKQSDSFGVTAVIAPNIELKIQAHSPSGIHCIDITSTRTYPVSILDAKEVQP